MGTCWCCFVSEQLAERWHGVCFGCKLDRLLLMRLAHANALPKLDLATIFGTKMYLRAV